MRVDGVLLDLRTVAGATPGSQLIGGRRHLGVGADRVVISHLARREKAGIGIGTPDPAMVVYCVPTGFESHRSPVDRDGWLDLSSLTQWKEYWLELDMVGGIRIERADSDGVSSRWYWPFPLDLWRMIQCG